jgi:heterotetrameric sarcosine oxidase delta subunit
MFRIPCPWCGLRDAAEFRHLGEVSQPPDPRTASAAQWRSHLYDKRNVAGWTTESWFHRAGCRSVITVERNTMTNAVRPTGASDEPMRPGDVGSDAGSPDADSAPA